MRALIEAIKDSPLGQLMMHLGDGLPRDAVKLIGDEIHVTGSDKDEVVGAIRSAMSAAKKMHSKMPTAYGWRHQQNSDSYTVVLSPRFD